MTVLLIVGGAVMFYALERSHNLDHMSAGRAAMKATFQSVTCRTAGFNTIDIRHLSNASLFVTIVLMMIGGAPGSLAGGIKVTTFGVILIVVLSRLRGLSKPSMFGRSIDREDLERALSLLLLLGGLVAITTLLLCITELGGRSHVDSRGMFLELLFECVSAFGTVGLSTGITPELSVSGRLLIAFAMFTGRLGPLTLAFAVERRRHPPAYRFPEERIMIG